MTFVRALLIGCALTVAGCGETFQLKPDGGNDDMSVGKQQGDPCTTSDECASTHCVDNFCCGSACSDLCEACNVAGSEGTCTPVPANTDPAMECSGMAPGDGGTLFVDGGLNIPDAGLMSTMSACAGTCNGSRACALPGSEKSCGTHFCNDDATVVGYQCDGTGGCTLQNTTCVAYTCGDDACKTTCTQQTDCQDDFYCNSAHVCVAKSGNGIGCDIGYECESGFCVGDNGNPSTPKVCCATECSSSIPGSTCVKPQHEGTCQCSKQCDSGSSCVLTYPDVDGDGFGDRNYTATASDVYCDGGAQNPIPAGRVADNTDCYDHNIHAYPGPRTTADQTCTQNGEFQCCNSNYFYSNRGDGSFDYDCDGVESPEQNEWATNAECHFCDTTSSPACYDFDQACGTANESATLASCTPLTTCSNRFGGGTYQGCGCPPIFFLLCPAREPNNTGFIGHVACGNYGTRHNCGKCSAIGGAATDSTTFTQQGCL